MTYKETASTNFLIILNEVVSAGHVKNRTEFAKAVGEYQQNISLIERGTRAPTIEQMATACELWGYNMNWLVLGKGPKMIDPKSLVPLEQRVNELERKVFSIQKKIKK